MIAVNITPLGLTVDGHAGYAFENDVKMYGTQTDPIRSSKCSRLENDVKMYSTQTFSGQILLNRTFENDVKFIFVNNKNR